jgi:hypothetical protein
VIPASVVAGLAERDGVYWRGRPSPERRHKRALSRGFGSTPLDKGASRVPLVKKLANGGRQLCSHISPAPKIKRVRAEKL